MTVGDLKWWLRLLAVPGVGPGLYGELLRALGGPEAALKASAEALMAVPRIDARTASAIRGFRDEAWVEGQVRAAGEAGVTIVTLEDSEYPPLLREIHAPPPILFVRGACETLGGACVAVVGARASTTYGRQVAGALSRGLTDLGFTLVSGMARGIDSVAHRVALDHQGKTVAVLGCGADVVYPPENRGLYEDLGRKGAVVSEFPMGTGPDPHRFPQRNRIISGLSLGVVVVEAGLQSGALLTARHALEQGREVFAVPGPVTSEKSAGVHRLIQEGARLVQNAGDIAEELLTSFRASPASSPSEAAEPDEDLSEEEKRVLASLSGVPAHIDAIALATGFSPGKTLGILLALELSGRVSQQPGKMFVRG